MDVIRGGGRGVVIHHVRYPLPPSPWHFDALLVVVRRRRINICSVPANIFSSPLNEVKRELICTRHDLTVDLNPPTTGGFYLKDYFTHQSISQDKWKRIS